MVASTSTPLTNLYLYPSLAPAKTFLAQNVGCGTRGRRAARLVAALAECSGRWFRYSIAAHERLALVLTIHHRCVLVHGVSWLIPYYLGITSRSLQITHYPSK